MNADDKKLEEVAKKASEAPVRMWTKHIAAKKMHAACSPETIIALVRIARAADETLCELRDRNPAKLKLIAALKGVSL
jgi:hypothetical protein